MELAHATYKGVQFGQFFDDIAQTHSPPKGGNFYGFLKSVAFLATSFVNNRLTYSRSKTVLVASTPKLTRYLVKRLAGMGVDLKGAQVVRDLGVDFVAGGKRLLTTIES